MSQRLLEIAGPVRHSVNQHGSADNSIHNDDVASKLGFRGGTVAGSIHLELFPPLLLDTFGEHWFEHGTLSMNFKNPTTDREGVRAIVQQPIASQNAQVSVRVEREDGLLVGEGTASAGDPGIPTALRSLDLRRYAPGELRILDGVGVGEEIPAKSIDCAASTQTDRLDVITEPLDWYSGDSPWGGIVASPATIVHYLFAYPSRVVGRNAGRAVGLFGAIEVSNESGPMVLDRTYSISGKVLAVGESPKTEYCWFESYADDEDGKLVASMLMQLRWMKASSELYAE